MFDWINSDGNNKTIFINSCCALDKFLHDIHLQHRLASKNQKGMSTKLTLVNREISYSLTRRNKAQITEGKLTVKNV